MSQINTEAIDSSNRPKTTCGGGNIIDEIQKLYKGNLNEKAILEVVKERIFNSSEEFRHNRFIAKKLKTHEKQ